MSTIFFIPANIIFVIVKILRDVFIIFDHLCKENSRIVKMILDWLAEVNYVISGLNAEQQKAVIIAYDTS